MKVREWLYLNKIFKNYEVDLKPYTPGSKCAVNLMQEKYK